MPLDRHDPRPCCVYRWYGPVGQLLYVGAALDPDKRWKQAKARGDWAQFATRRTVEWFESVRVALAVEKAAIKTEKPLLNMLHVPGYVAPDGRSPAVVRVIELGGGDAVHLVRDSSSHWRIASDPTAPEVLAGAASDFRTAGSDWIEPEPYRLPSEMVPRALTPDQLFFLGR